MGGDRGGQGGLEPSFRLHLELSPIQKFREIDIDVAPSFRTCCPCLLWQLLSCLVMQLLHFVNTINAQPTM